ncbi:MAG: hypothetical protein BWY87_01321 [Deltaproteobacteria bacterium ADurb.Bin510]|nr:MAG: hypothetical protein BWY87_01321 [Deltaproteobacteria bacterium ADurb.Bin510]
MGPFVHQVEGLLGLGTARDHAAQLLEHLGRGRTDDRIVLDQQYAGRPVGFGLGGRLVAAGRPGQQNRDAGAQPGLAGEAQTAAQICDDAVHHGQPHARGLGVGGEEGLADPGGHLGRHAAAIVCHAQFPVAVALKLAGARTFRPEPPRPQIDADAAGAGSDGVHGVGHEVDDELVELGGVALDEGLAAGAVEVERDAARDGGAQEAQAGLEQVDQIESGLAAAILATEGLDLAHQVAGALAGRQDAFEQAAAVAG